jgi:hypothetical protein
MARHNTQAAAARLRRGASQESTPPSSGNVSPSHSAAAPPSASKRAGISHLHLRRHKRDIMRDMWRRVWRLKDAGGQAKVTLFLFLAFALWLLFFFGAPKELPDLARHPAQAHGANRSAQAAASAAATLMNATAASAAATLMNATAALGIATRLAANYSLTAPPRVRVQALRSYPHDPRAFTQGLLIHRGQMWESTGLYGQSELRRVSLDSGGVQQRWRMDGSYFAEGLCVWNDKLVQLTWQNRVGFIYDTANFTAGPSDRFSYDTEGWGVTSDGSSLIISDGSSTLYFHDPQVRLRHASMRGLRADGEGHAFACSAPRRRSSSAQLICFLFFLVSIVRLSRCSGASPCAPSASQSHFRPASSSAAWPHSCMTALRSELLRLTLRLLLLWLPFLSALVVNFIPSRC